MVTKTNLPIYLCDSSDSSDNSDSSDSRNSSDRSGRSEGRKKKIKLSSQKKKSSE